MLKRTYLEAVSAVENPVLSNVKNWKLKANKKDRAEGYRELL
jgi:hypothetical protein